MPRLGLRLNVMEVTMSDGSSTRLVAITAAARAA
jgi:hypothetical protein